MDGLPRHVQYFVILYMYSVVPVGAGTCFPGENGYGRTRRVLRTLPGVAMHTPGVISWGLIGFFFHSQLSYPKPRKPILKA